MAYDHPSAAEARLGCVSRALYECFVGTAPLGVVSEVSEPGACCSACEGEPRCVAYNHKLYTRSCELFDAEPRVAFDDDSGCSAGSPPRLAVSAAPTEEAASTSSSSGGDAALPNLVFLVVESTDGRTWSEGYADSAIPLPNIRKLQSRGYEFRRHYSNAPVCCPSRATFWSGRHAHHISHSHNGLEVTGAWNNYEGLPFDYAARLDQTLARRGYSVKVSGKTDWAAGGHSETVWLAAWTMYALFPYDVNATGGWRDETICGEDAVVEPGGGPGGEDSLFHGDWGITRDTTAWIEAQNADTPWFAFSGMSIVHPSYRTTAFWYDQIRRDKVDVPAWSQTKKTRHQSLFSSLRCQLSTRDERGSLSFLFRKRARTPCSLSAARFRGRRKKTREAISVRSIAGVSCPQRRSLRLRTRCACVGRRVCV